MKYWIKNVDIEILETLEDPEEKGV